MTLVRDMDARIDRVSSDESYLEDCLVFNYRRPENGERMLTLCSENRFFPASTNFRCLNHWHVKWTLPSSGQRLTETNHSAINHQRRGCLEDGRAYWSTPLIPTPR